MRELIQPSHIGRVTEIKPIEQFGVAVAIVSETYNDRLKQAWYPIEDGSVQPGQLILVTPQIQFYENGGSLTFFKLSPIETVASVPGLSA